MVLLAKPLWSRIFANDALTRGLGDEEARVLIEWLAERAEALSSSAIDQDAARREMEALCRRARAISRFVHLWCHQRECGAAHQLAAAERFYWPLPGGWVDPCELMENIVDWEDEQAGR